MTVRVEHGDSRDVLKSLADASVDSCVTDPPYSLVSIQKRFGKPGSAAAKDRDGLYKRASSGFMGQQWDTGETAHDPEFWREVLRVLKPGAHVVAFAGTRTYHRVACAIEDAGFEIRDQIGWCFGSGFPKSHNIGKAIDKRAGAGRAIIRERYTVKRIKPGATAVREGAWGKQDIPYTAADTAPATEEAAAWEGWGTALKPAWEPICLARKPLIGTVAENVQQHGTGALNIDGCRVHTADDLNGGAYNGSLRQRDEYTSSDSVAGAVPLSRLNRDAGKFQQPAGRWPANLCTDGSEEVLAAFPNAPGQQRAVGPEFAPKVGTAVYGDYGPRPFVEPRGDSGSAARFFYSAKAGEDDRCDSKHPTIKPVALMRWLARLITPPKGLVLDPFAGSGTTAVACLRERFDCIVVEREAQYIADIKRRLARLSGLDSPLFAGTVA